MHSIFKWQKINFQTSQFNHFAFCCKSMTYGGHNVAKVFFFTCLNNPIWVWVQRIPSFFLHYSKQKYGHHLCKAWGFMLQNQGYMPWWFNVNENLCTVCRKVTLHRYIFSSRSCLADWWYYVDVLSCSTLRCAATVNSTLRASKLDPQPNIAVCLSAFCQD